MKNLKLAGSALAAFLLALLALPASADEVIQLGQPTYSGTGCPDGTASATLSPDSAELSVLFDQYTVAVGGNSGKRMERKTCTLNIPVRIPAGTSIAVVEVDYRGFHDLPTRALSELTVQYSLGAGIFPRFMRRYVGPISRDFLAQQRLRASDVTWSACGGTANLKVDTSLLVVTNGQQESSLGSLDSADLKSGLTYVVQSRRCNPSPLVPRMQRRYMAR